MKIIFLRHGETETNVQGKIHSTFDTADLTEKGKIQISKTLPLLRQAHVEKVYSSPELRALNSAKIISQQLETSLEVLEDLKERNWGDWSGKAWDEVSVNLDKMKLSQRYNFIPPNGESWYQMESRLEKALDKIVSGKAKCICVITHGGTLRALMPILMNKEKSASFKYNFENASITIFNFKTGMFKELVVNETHHLL